MPLSIDITDDTAKRLAAEAERLNVPVAQLAAAAVRDLLTQPAADFDQVATRVLEKNRELYQRLA